MNAKRIVSLSATAIGVLAFIEMVGPVSTIDVVKGTDVGKTAAHKHLVTLRCEGLIEAKQAGPTATGRRPYLFKITQRGRSYLGDQRSRIVGSRMSLDPPSGALPVSG